MRSTYSSYKCVVQMNENIIMLMQWSMEYKMKRVQCVHHSMPYDVSHSVLVLQGLWAQTGLTIGSFQIMMSGWTAGVKPWSNHSSQSLTTAAYSLDRLDGWKKHIILGFVHWTRLIRASYYKECIYVSHWVESLYIQYL